MGDIDVPLIVPLLTIPSTNRVISTAQDHGKEVLHPNKDKPNTTDEKKLDGKSTVSAMANLLLCGVRDSMDIFGPLKSVAWGLYFILDNCEVWSPTDVTICNAYKCSSK